MKTTSQIAKHLRDVYFGGNWTTVNYKNTMADINWQQATTQVHSFNTIATLVYHTGYYVTALIRVLQNESLNAKDELSFDHPPIQSQDGWQTLLDATFYNAEKAAVLLEQFPEAQLGENFTDEKYGNYYRNIHGIIEHLHYHLGQIVLIKKIIVGRESNSKS